MIQGELPMMNHSTLPVTVAAALLGSLLTAGALSAPAYAGLDVNINLGVPPPTARVEVTPGPRPGYVWAQGYWAYDGGQYVWVSGRWETARAGYRWSPERWESRSNRYYFVPGHWEAEERR
jgi:hypothetical protein